MGPLQEQDAALNLQAISPAPHYAILIYLFITEEPRLALNSFFLPQPLECWNAGTSHRSQLYRNILSFFFFFFMLGIQMEG